MAKVTVDDLIDYLDYCFRDIHFNYRGLTDTEQRAINRNTFEKVVSLIKMKNGHTLSFPEEATLEGTEPLIEFYPNGVMGDIIASGRGHNNPGGN